MGGYFDRMLFVMLLVALVIACSQPAVESPVAPKRESAFQELVDSVVADDEAIHGAALAVISPTLGLEWEGAAGFADPATGTPMTPANPVRIASNTKTYVAAAVLRLAEDGRLDLDAPIAGHLPEPYVEGLQADGYDPSAMTIRHLLTHTSGLFDHSETGAYTDAIIADPTHLWTPMEQFSMAMETGDPHAPPGSVYTYCDTGYVLLGLITEQVSGLPLATAVRELVDFDALGLASTWWEILEDPPPGVGDRAHQFFGELDVYTFQPYFDLFGGGGIVTTMAELARFHGGLFRGEVYDNTATTDLMLSTLDGIEARPDASDGALPAGAYRMGVWVLETDGHATYHHTGFWGTMAVHIPDFDLTLAATVNQNQSKPVIDRVLREVIDLAEKAGDS